MSAEASTGVRWVDRSAGRWFYAGMAIISALVCVVSFMPSIMDSSHRLGSYTALTMAHSIAFCLWPVVFIAQPLLVQTGRIALHRSLGAASIFLAAAMVVLGYATTIAMGRRGFDLSGDLGLNVDPPGAAFQMVFPLLDITVFGILIAAGYLYRRRAATHKRLMLFATVALLPAPFAHLIGHSPALRSFPPTIVLLILSTTFASAVYDFIRFRRIHPVSLWVGIGLFVADNLCATVIGPSAAWRQFIAWLVS